ILDESAAELVQHLENPNGWWRENAQKLLVVRRDTTVADALRDMVTGSSNHLARIHALWTLDGLNVLDDHTLLAGLRDTDARVRKTAAWIADGIGWDGNSRVFDALIALKDDTDAEVRFQVALNMRSNDSQEAKAVLDDLLQRYPDG